MKKILFVFVFIFYTLLFSDMQVKASDIFEFGEDLNISNERISWSFFNKKATMITETKLETTKTEDIKITPTEEVKPQVTKQVKPVVLPNISIRKGTKNRGHVVYVNNKQAAWFVKDLGNYTTEKRAKIYANNLKYFLSKNGNPKDIKPVRRGNQTVIRANGMNLITVDELNARSFGVSTHELSYTWANNTRIALGAKSLKKDYSALSRGLSGNNSRYIGQTSTGMASWYGGNFHGKKSSDGSRYNKEEFTAAHRTYPFGTLVKVTNLRNNKSCVVKITDRGPYSKGRILDVSKETAKELGMISSGVAKVKIEVVGQY